ncbi:unnamed protein product [Trichobilharzia regenti]|nr:unnamed protein product [Trichobilharzia regenti]
MISKKLAIIPGNEVYDNWLSPSVPVYFSVYLYNLTNPEEVLNGDRPKFSEVGPYGANALPSAYKSISIFYTFTPFVTRSPREIMWGYEDSFLKFCTSINFCESSLGGMMAQVICFGVLYLYYIYYIFMHIYIYIYIYIYIRMQRYGSLV